MTEATECYDENDNIADTLLLTTNLDDGDGGEGDNNNGGSGEDDIRHDNDIQDIFISGDAYCGSIANPDISLHPTSNMWAITNPPTTSVSFNEEKNDSRCSSSGDQLMRKPAVAMPFLSTLREFEQQNSSYRNRSRINQHEITHRRVICKARGMPESHNEATAYICVPQNCSHGATLPCSYPGCAQSGRHFCYCSVCEEVVTKRNFIRRHGHGIISRGMMSRGSGDASRVGSEDGTDMAKMPKSMAMKKKSSDDALRNDHRKRTCLWTQFGNGKYLQSDDDDQHKHEQSSAKTHIDKRNNHAAPATSSSTTVETARVSNSELRWLQMYRTRPPRSADMESKVRWLRRILKEYFADEVDAKQEQDLLSSPSTNNEDDASDRETLITDSW